MPAVIEINEIYRIRKICNPLIAKSGSKWRRTWQPLDPCDLIDPTVKHPTDIPLAQPKPHQWQCPRHQPKTHALLTWFPKHACGGNLVVFAPKSATIR